jgi:Tfp pilus assembly protein PilV
MLRTSNDGFTLIEVVMAVVLVMLGVVAMMQIIPVAWFNEAKATDRSEAAEMLQREFEATQALIMNRCLQVATGNIGTKNTSVSGQGLGSFDRVYSVNKIITLVNAGADYDEYDLTITVARSGLAVSRTRRIMSQNDYMTTPTCAPRSAAVNLLYAGYSL